MEVIGYEIPSTISAVFATIDHELSMLDQMFVMTDQVLLMPRAGVGGVALELFNPRAGVFNALHALDTRRLFTLLTYAR